MVNLGTITGFTIPGTNQSQFYDSSYLDSGIFPNDPSIVDSSLEKQIEEQVYLRPTTGYTGFTFVGIGASRIAEKKKYGSNTYFDSTTGNDIGGDYTGYTFTYTGQTGLLNQTGGTATTILEYRDYADGMTKIIGNVTGFTQEEVINFMLTRNEHFLGFVEQPTVYSDVFIERGKQGVMEKNLRLGEIDNLGELNIYGNGFFKVKTQ